MATKRAKETQDITYTGTQLVRSEHFRDLRDVAEAVLNMDEAYTLKEADEEVQRYMKGKVN
jgi:hypothetical protein